MFRALSRTGGPLAAGFLLLFTAPGPTPACSPGDAEGCNLGQPTRTTEEHRQFVESMWMSAFGTPMPDPTEDDDICPHSEIVGHGLVGQSSVAEFFMLMERFDPSYRAVWEGSLEWIKHDGTPGSPGLKWEAIYCDSIPGPGRISGSWNAEAFARGYLLNGNTDYLATKDLALQWVDSEKIDAFHLYPDSDGYFWIEWDYASVPPHFYNLGALFGTTAIGRNCLEVYRMTGDPLALDLAKGVGRTLRDAKVDAPVGHFWHSFGGGPFDQTQGTAFCAGASGNVEFLVEMDRTLGSAGEVDYRALAEGAIAWLESVAVAEGGGLKWPGDHAKADPKFTTPPGGGATGPGRAFLAAYQAWGEANHLALAKAAGDWLLSVADQEGSLTSWSEVPGNVDDKRMAWCRGNEGVMQFLFNLGRTASTPAYTQAALQNAEWLAFHELLTVHGPVIPKKPNEACSNVGFIWGLAGLAHPFYTGTERLLQNPAYQSVAINVANYLAAIKIPENGGHYWKTISEYDLSGGTTDVVPTSFSRPPDDLDARVFPNPTAGPSEIRVQLSRPVLPGETLDLALFDVTGRRVLTREVSFAGTELVVPWDGRNEDGRPVPRGLYFLRASIGDDVETKKVAVIR